MALAPRASLRSVALLLSNGKPRLSSLFSSAPTATPGTGTPAAPSVKHPGGSDAPIAPAIQPPSAPVQGSGSTCPQERFHQRLPEDCTPRTLTHKHLPKKHHHRNHKVCEDPDARVADGSSRSSSLDNPKHPTPEPNGRARIHGGTVGKTSAHHHRNHKVCEDPDAGVTDGSLRSSSHDKPKHPTPEPNGRAMIHGGAVGKPSAHHHRNHKVCEDPDAGVADGSSRSSSACTLQEDCKHSFPGGSCSASEPLPDKLPKEHSDDHKGREDPVARAPRVSSRDTPGHGVTEPCDAL